MEYAFGDYVLDLSRRELRRGIEPVALEPQVFDLLAYLLQNHERVVSKDDLIENVWNGRIVSDSTLTSRINAVRKAVGDDGQRQVMLRTLRNKGIRFAGAVRVLQSNRAQTIPILSAVPQFLNEPTFLRSLERPSIAVLPFSALGTGNLQTLANGITEDIITELARIGGILVCADNSNRIYKERSVDTKDIGCVQGAKYVIEGSVRQAGGRLRVTAQLIETATGNHIWAERYDSDCADSFETQDEVTSSIVASVQTQLRWHEGLLIERSGKQDLDIAEAIAHGWKEVYQLTRESLERALERGRALVRIAPKGPKGHQLIAAAAYQLTLMGFTDPFGSLKETAFSAALQALLLDDRDEFGHWIWGMVQGNLFARYSEALSAYGQALDINPNFSLAIGGMGSTLAYAGRASEALEKTRLSIRMNPRDPSIFFRYSSMSLAHFVRGENSDALEWAVRSTGRKSNWWLGHALVAAARARLGDRDAAMSSVAALVSLLPTISLSNLPFIPLTQDAQLQEFCRALKHAGLPG